MTSTTSLPRLHTAAPWFPILSPDGAYTVDTSPDRNQAVILCARNPWPGREAEMHANARLMAAAPDLLDAALAAQRELDHVVNVAGRKGGLYEDALNKLRAATAKAMVAD